MTTNDTPLGWTAPLTTDDTPWQRFSLEDQACTLLWELMECGYLDDFVLTLTNPLKQAAVNRFQTRVSGVLSRSTAEQRERMARIGQRILGR